jgi:hypothetical protein
MLKGKMATYHFTDDADECILATCQKKYNSISEYNNFVEILNKICYDDTKKKKKKNSMQ